LVTDTTQLERESARATGGSPRGAPSRATAAGADLRAGDTVEVLTEAEIRATLDVDGRFEGLPFMPEMVPYCGRRFRVARRADKVCIEGSLLRRIERTVFLDELRCDGSAHDGCDRDCLLFWKEAWLRRVDGAVERVASSEPGPPKGPLPPRSQVHSCQSTHLLAASVPLSRWDLGQYVRDVTHNGFSALQVAQSLFIVVYNRIARSLKLREFGGAVGKLTRTPAVELNLRPGELVEVRSVEEIEATLDGYAQNRGLRIEWEMLRHAGRRFRVLRRVERMILETNGTMREIRHTVLLEGSACEGVCKRACARGTHPMWREAWLKRVPEPATELVESLPADAVRAPAEDLPALGERHLSSS
jgi:hypothetical protein